MQTLRPLDLHLAMPMILFLLYLTAMDIQRLDGAAIWNNNTISTTKLKQLKWIDASLEWTRKRNCSNELNQKLCRHISNRDKTQMNIYMAVSKHKKDKLKIILSEKIFRKQKYVADAVIAIDVFPELAFGHPVYVYAVKRSQNREKCQERLGKYVDNEDCIFAVKLFHHKIDSMIETLPRVYAGSDNSYKQMLTCQSEMAGFASCQSRMNYHHKWNNVASAMQSYPPIKFKSCGTNKTESIAILISGFWNNQMSSPRYQDNIIKLRNNLLNLGYRKDNIITFFAGGDKQLDFIPAVMDLQIVRSIREACKCSSRSLFLYLNSPTVNFNKLLLLDIENNGFAEYYQTLPYKQIVNELRRCSAKNKIIVVDQSHSNQFVNKIKDQHVKGAIVVGSADFMNYSYGYKLTRHFIQAHSSHCIGDIINEAANSTNGVTHIAEDAKPFEYNLYGSNCITKSLETKK
ncbi:hypothetical protein TrispH2_008513 [Trichoplax sp. H2]|nr:hypothetical protein TrispH2_008513 [Trichoplax sp. H2]|eukprot:RDD40469.1 hypothetical protein TrispH2_008513 [Trichoplax sp. H2]